MPKWKSVPGKGWIPRDDAARIEEETKGSPTEGKIVNNSTEGIISHNNVEGEQEGKIKDEADKKKLSKIQADRGVKGSKLTRQKTS